jgi:hypothetical protein
MLSRHLAIVASLAFGLSFRPAWASWQVDGNLVTTTWGHHYGIDAAPDGAGGAILVWNAEIGGSKQVYAGRIDWLGSVKWAPGGVSVHDCNGGNPSLVSDGAGGALIAYEIDCLFPSFIQGIAIQRLDDSGTRQWGSTGVVLAANPPSPPGAPRPQICGDDQGGAFVAWKDVRNDAGDVYVARVDASGTPLWITGGVGLCTAVGEQIPSAIIADGSGGAIVLWTDKRTGNRHVYVGRVNANGLPLWSPNGAAICTVPDDPGPHWVGIRGPQLVSDGAGGAICVWEDIRTANDRAYAQRINGSGMVLWTPNGVPLAPAGVSQQIKCGIVTDGAGGAIVAWDGAVQRITALGTTAWGPGGVAVGGSLTADGPTIVPDDSGGAIVTWTGYGTDGWFDIFAQSVDPSGSVRWGGSGVPVCTVPYLQFDPVITQSTNGGAIVAWQDFRGRQIGADENMIYAQRLSASGAWGCPEPSITSVVDVPGDQGSFVTVRWQESDDTVPWYVYYLYRDDWGTWTYVGEVADNGGSTYSLNVPTLGDSACNDPFGHQFKIISESSVSTEESNIAFGRSVDNLVPGAPQLTGQLVGNTLTLTWTRTAPDLSGWWTIYFGIQPGGSTCGTSCYFADVYDTTYTVAFSPPLQDMYWSVRAFDYHCNFGLLSNEFAILVPNTPVGANVSVFPLDTGTGTAPAQVTFENVAAEGRTSLEIGPSGPPLPGTFVTGDSRYYNLSTTATTSGEITVCISYDEGALTVPEGGLRLLHWDTTAMPPAWEDITSSLDTNANIVCGVAKNLSPFVIGADVATGVDDHLPTEFVLHANVPNPFNPVTIVAYEVPAGGADVSISVFDVSGRLVRTLVDEHRPAGVFSVQWNGTDDRGQRVASGVYFYRMRAGEFVDTKKMVLLK